MINRFLFKWIMRLVKSYYKRTHFFEIILRVDKLNTIRILSEEVFWDKGYTRYGTREFPMETYNGRHRYIEYLLYKETKNDKRRSDKNNK